MCIAEAPVQLSGPRPGTAIAGLAIFIEYLFLQFVSTKLRRIACIADARYGWKPEQGWRY
jgi:hypothetical protein